MSNTFPTAILASSSFPIANLPFANNKYAGTNPGICLVILYNNLIPFPIGLAGFGFSVPSIIYFVDTGRK